MPVPTRGKRVLIYSHDSFGLGHLRRCRAIAHALAGRHSDLSVLILSGSPIIGSFEFRSRVDFVRVPGIIKLRDGDYKAHSLGMPAEEALALRAQIMLHTADIFDPDLFLVDKEPLGLRGEVEPALRLLRRRGTRLVLGLRDVMDEPDLLAPEWERKNVLPALRDLYHELWVYGLPQICDPLAGIELPGSVRRKMSYTGYLKREVPLAPPSAEAAAWLGKPFVLVTPGGGGDGDDLIDWVVRAYETDRALPLPALIVFGPFMPLEQQAALRERISRLPDVAAITFDSNLEALIAGATGVVAMGGYNTFCEILSFDRPAVLVPRTRPRREQHIRAERAEALGLVRMLADDGVRDPRDMAVAIRGLANQPRPSQTVVPGLLDGLESVDRLAMRALASRQPAMRLAAPHD